MTEFWTSMLWVLISVFSFWFTLSKCLGMEKNFLILLALFGPNLLSNLTSVRPLMSYSPFWTKIMLKEVISFPIMHPLTDFLFMVPSLLALYPLVPGANNNFFFPIVNTPCFIPNPFLSLPPVILKTQPSKPIPKSLPLTSWPNLQSINFAHCFSSFNSYLICVLFKGYARFSIMLT